MGHCLRKRLARVDFQNSIKSRSYFTIARVSFPNIKKKSAKRETQGSECEKYFYICFEMAPAPMFDSLNLFLDQFFNITWYLSTILNAGDILMTDARRRATCPRAHHTHIHTREPALINWSAFHQNSKEDSKMAEQLLFIM